METKSTIVLLGDWYIDENWLVSPQELYHSAAKGKVHYLARHGSADENVTNLCASAALLETLRANLATECKDAVEFIAYGAWNPEDDDLIRRILCRKDQEEMHLSQYTLSNSSSPWCTHCRASPTDCRYSDTLINLATMDDKKLVSTNRTIRCFQGHGAAMPEQLFRFDWILPLQLENERYLRMQKDLASRNVVAVLLVDHGTGAVNENSIKQLLRSVRNKNAHWFVRTKITNPSWMDLLQQEGVTLEMNVADFRLASRQKGSRRWCYGHHLGRAALELLGEMTGSYIYHPERERRNQKGVRSRNAVVFLDDNTAFAMSAVGAKEERYRCFSISQPPGPRQIINLGRTTIFCAALFAQRLRAILKCGQSEPAPNRLGLECSKALSCAYHWSKVASRKWSNEEFSLYDDYDNALASINEPTGLAEHPYEGPPWEEWDYEDLWKLWNDSSEGLGTVKLPTKKPGSTQERELLQLWRGYGVLEDYICVGGPKRDAINHLVSTIDDFKSSGTWRRSLCCLVTSPPGWGKSFLAKSLASRFDMEFLEFSIAQMCDNRDVMDCFASIASAQSKTNRPTLVFIDEVNADIEGHSVLPLLLSPLWGGTFVKDRQSLRLRPGVWIFASTQTAAEIREDPKGSDFLSRLNGPIVELDSGRQHWAEAITRIRGELHAVSNMAWAEYQHKIYTLPQYKTFQDSKVDSLKTEQVYLLVSLLNARWGPISRIEKKVLELFRDLLPINGSRSLEIFTSCFDGIQRGEVRRTNVPRIDRSAELRRHVILPKEWPRDMGSSELIEIEIRIM
jgi:hypothetical protein